MSEVLKDIYGDDHITLQIDYNPLNCTLKKVNFTVCKFDLNKAVKEKEEVQSWVTCTRRERTPWIEQRAQANTWDVKQLDKSGDCVRGVAGRQGRGRWLRSPKGFKQQNHRSNLIFM